MRLQTYLFAIMELDEYMYGYDEIGSGDKKRYDRARRQYESIYDGLITRMDNLENKCKDYEQLLQMIKETLADDGIGIEWSFANEL